MVYRAKKRREPPPLIFSKPGSYFANFIVVEQPSCCVFPLDMLALGMCIFKLRLRFSNPSDGILGFIIVALHFLTLRLDLGLGSLRLASHLRLLLAIRQRR